MTARTLIRSLEDTIDRYRMFLKKLPESDNHSKIVYTWDHCQRIEREIKAIQAQIERLQGKHPNTRIKWHTIKIQSKLNDMTVKIRLTKKEKDTLLKKAIAKGFKEGVMFTSAIGTKGCFVSGKLVIKDSGDIVIKGGVGCVYDAEADTWGKIEKI